MVFFFALITKEVVEATIPGGALHPWRRAAMPIAAAIGASPCRSGCTSSFVHYSGEHMLADGWIAACAIDIPGSYVIARMIFGRHPAVPFLLLLAISADAIGLAFVAVLQPVGDAHPALGVGFMVVAIGAAFALRRSGVKNFWLYLIGAGRVVLVARCSSAVSTPRSRSCRSCRSFRTGDAIRVCSTSRRRRRTTR